MLIVAIDWNLVFQRANVQRSVQRTLIKFVNFSQDLVNSIKDAIELSCDQRRGSH